MAAGGKDTTRKMVITAVLGALTAIFTFTPVGMITLPPPLPRLTLSHIPVIIAAVVEGPAVGMGVGLVFGLCSLISNWQSGVVGLSLFFRNPLVSVLPRLIVPLMAWLAASTVEKYAKNGIVRRAAPSLGAIAGSLTNTVLCLGMIMLLYSPELTELVNNMVSGGSADAKYMANAGSWLVAAVGLPNGIIEAVAAAVLVPAVTTAVRGVKRRSR